MSSVGTVPPQRQLPGPGVPSHPGLEQRELKPISPWTLLGGAAIVVGTLWRLARRRPRRSRRRQTHLPTRSERLAVEARRRTAGVAAMSLLGAAVSTLAAGVQRAALDLVRQPPAVPRQRPASRPSPTLDDTPSPPRREAISHRRPVEKPSAWALVKEAFSDFSEDKATRLAAALAYYTVFSLAPLLVIVLAIAGLFLGADAASQGVQQQLEGFLGPEGAEGVNEMVTAAQHPNSGLFAAVGLVALAFGASGVFAQLQDSLNTIWEVQPKSVGGLRGILVTIRQRFLSFAMVLGLGFLLLVSLVLSAAVSALTGMIGFGDYEVLAHATNLGVSLIVVSLLFAMMFKFLPDVEITWRDVWIGALITAVLFTIGKFLIGMYLGRAAVGSAYGAAGSLVIVLLWTYYSGLILFLGAEFTQVYARMYGSRIRPAENAEPVTAEARAQQGLKNDR